MNYQRKMMNSNRPKYRSDDAENPHQKMVWNAHRERVRTVKAMVDSSSPIVKKSSYASPANFNKSVAEFVKIERDNARMLHRIATIMEGEASIDNRLHPSLRNPGSGNKTRDRQMKLLQITFDNLKLFQRIESVKPMYSRQLQLDDYARQEKIMELTSFYPLHWKVPPPSTWDNFADAAFENAAKCPRPNVFLTLETDREPLGQIIIELRADVVPFSAENFRCLCTGERGLSYKCTEIHRIIPGILWQGGDVSGREGRGCGKSIYGDSFPDENFRLKHTTPGTVSMVNAGKDTNASQFLISAKKLEALNGVNVVVGKVIMGMDVLDKVSALVTPSGRPKYRVWISRCGQVGESGEIPIDLTPSTREGAETDTEPATAEE